jgi:hypothetical protein
MPLASGGSADLTICMPLAPAARQIGQSSRRMGRRRPTVDNRLTLWMATDGNRTCMTTRILLSAVARLLAHLGSFHPYGPPLRSHEDRPNHLGRRSLHSRILPPIAAAAGRIQVHPTHNGRRFTSRREPPTQRGRRGRMHQASTVQAVPAPRPAACSRLICSRKAVRACRPTSAVQLTPLARP